MSKGWIRFYRELIEHPLVGFKKPYSKAEAWIWMLSQARFEDTKEYRDFGGKERLIDMPRGTLTHSIRFMSKAFGWSTSKLINFLKILENDSQITQKPIQQITQITICNYNAYQGDSIQQPIQQRYSRNTAEIQQKNEIKNVKKDNNDKNKNTVEFDFNEIWGKYPKKDGRKESLKHFNATVKTKKDWDDINIALENYLNSRDVKRKYIKNGSTWFNNWQDWVAWVDVECPEEEYSGPTLEDIEKDRGY